LISLESTLAVVAHDAGAANLILAWLKEFHCIKFKVCLAGPAVRLFNQQYSNIPNLSLIDALNGATALLSGTSGVSDLEHNARIKASQMDIYSIAVIDHWVNYKMRFERAGQYILPTQIWLSDQYAFELAKEIFPITMLRKIPSFYLNSLVEEIKENERKGDFISDNIKILYVLEPVKKKWGNSNVSGEFQALEYFITNLAFFGIVNKIEIRLRLHPSERAEKYADWCVQHQSYNLKLDTSHELSYLIAWADWVVGCETFAMIIALSAGKRTLSTLPPWAPNCAFPHNEISKLCELI